MSKKHKGEVTVYKGGGSKMAKTKFVTEVMENLTSAANAASSNVTLYPGANTSTSACNRAVTVSGLRWNFTANLGASTTAGGAVKWMVYVRRGAATVPTQAVPGSGTTVNINGYGNVNPNDILCWGIGQLTDGGDLPCRFEGATKTQRKMNEGDGLVLSVGIQTGGATDTSQFYGMVQTFLKS